MKSVVILSSREDAHIPYVARHLDHEPIIIDFQEMVDNGDMSVAFANNELTVQLRQRSIDACGVWLRRPRPVRTLRLPVRPEHLAYTRSAVLGFTDIFYTLFPRAVWISDYYAILRAENKPLQQSLAAQLGFALPATLYTTSAAQAEDFIKHHSTVVVKTLATDIPASAQGRPQAFYTRKVSAPQDLDLVGLRLAPAIFQQLVAPRHEFRVTVVGGDVFAARITSATHTSTVRDWRIGQHNGSIQLQPCQLPLEVQEKCVSLVARLGLVFGAIDLIEDKHGVFWFLEINPNGQWAFVEQRTAQPIGKAIARLLQGTKKMTSNQ